MRRKLKNGQAHISAALFLSGLLLMIGKAGACDLGAGLCEIIPGVLAGLAMMAVGAYGLWLEDIKKEAAPEKRNGTRKNIYINYKGSDVDCQ